MKILIFIILCLFTINAISADITFNNTDGLFKFENESGIFIKTSYIGWGPNWKWDAPKIKQIDTDKNNKKIQLNFKRQDVKSDVSININKSNIKYNYQHKFNKSFSDTIGGGVEFNLDYLPQIRNYGAKEPKLLPNNTGWVWEYKTGKVIKVVFSPEVSKIYFEKGNKSKIRVLFFSDKIKEGRGNTSMTINFPAKLSIASFNETDTENDTSSWFEESLSPIDSFIDLSSLNEKPAGTHGFVKAVADGLQFNDGTPARFFGTNVQANSLFRANKGLIKQHAKRIAKLGFNLVRLHHHDSSWVNPSIISKGNTTQEINTSALDNYFLWVKILRDEGIYVWVDLQVQRPWLEGDQIPGWDTDMESQSKNGMNVAKGFVYLNKRMQELSKKFNEELLTRINPYTKLALKDDPAVMAIMITNENDITYHYGNTFLKDKNHPYHQALFDDEVKKFAAKSGLPVKQVGQTWKPGPSKYLLNDIEARFNKDMIKHLRDLGVKVPITTTSLWGRNSTLFSLPALTTGDMIDAHSYTTEGVFKKGPLQKDPNFDSNFLHLLGQGQVVNKPFSITEYNVGEKSDLDNAYIPTVMVGSMAAFQGWDAIMLYGYSQDGFNGWRASPWSSYTHPAIMGVIPAMALLYREQHVAPAIKTIVLAPNTDELFNKNLSAKTSVTIRTALEQHRMVVAMPKTTILPWLKASKFTKDMLVIRDLNKSMLPENQNFIVSDTGEIKRNWRDGIMTINTAKSQLVMGRIGGRVIKLKDITVVAETPEAVIIFSSLDQEVIRASKRILVTAVAKVAKIRIKRKSYYISEPVKAKITFPSIYKGVRLVALLPDGREGNSQVLKRNNEGEYSFVISEKDKTHWYVITR
ncbi:MAG: hypothetical protein ACC657_09170 [Thiohalomonadales bacterium]